MAIAPAAVLSALRRAWARADLAPLRLALSALAEPLLSARRPAQATPEAARGVRALHVAGPLKVNPASGALTRGGRRLDAGPPEAVQTDWLVQAFPSPLSFPRVAPVWYGRRASVAALLTEALPAILALDRLAGAREAVALISVPLGRLNATQQALNAGLFQPRRVRVHAREKLIAAQGATVLTGVDPDAGLLDEARARLLAAFPAQAGEGAPVLLCAGGPARAARLWPGFSRAAADLAAAGVRVIDPETVPLADLVRALAAAPALAAPETAEAALAFLAPRAPLLLLPGAGPPLAAPPPAAWRGPIEALSFAIAAAQTGGAPPDGGTTHES